MIRQSKYNCIFATFGLLAKQISGTLFTEGHIRVPGTLTQQLDGDGM